MANVAEVIGPFPEGVNKEEYDKLRRRVLWSMPTGLYVVGSRSGDRRNFMTINLVTQVSTAPKQIGIAVLKESLTHELIASGKVFTLNLIDREDRELGRKFSKPSEVDVEAGTMNGYAFHDGKTGVPILNQAAAWAECELRQSVDVGDHTFFIGEVVNAEFPKEDVEILRMEDTRMNYGG